LEILTGNDREKLKGVFLTHAHIGHYTGLVHLGREVMGAQSVPIYAMPKMAKFLKSNGPWSQLVDLENIKIKKLKNGKSIELNKRISITPFLVPHRDEFSETVGYRIEGLNKSLIFIPDIDKWEKWSENIETVVNKYDYALLDGSFYTNEELPGRDMSEIPHPFIVESMEKLKMVPEKSGIHFIHLNHTNPALDSDSDAQKQIKVAGFNIAARNQIFKL
jgi:pyrroloquinoline quinone biosynthesis protein B